MVKNLPALQEAQAHPWVRKTSWRRDDNPVRYSCLENSMDRDAQLATVQGVSKRWTQLSN